MSFARMFGVGAADGFSRGGAGGYAPRRRGAMGVVRWAVAVAVCLWLAGCSGTDDGTSLMDQLELPTFGSEVFMGGDNDPLEVPPELDAPDTSGSLQVPGGRGRVSAAADAALNSRVLPQRLDMQLRRDGGVAWLAVDVSPATLWPQVPAFLQRSGFKVASSNPAHGWAETEWRERRVEVAGARGLARSRVRVRVRLEREPDAVTNVFISSREAGLSGGEWRLLPPDMEFERRMLLRFRDYLAAGREAASPQMASLDDARVALDINNMAGVAVLRVGQRYSKAWRHIGAALARSGIEMRDDDRSRGIYLVRYNDAGGGIDGAAARGQLLQLHLLAKGGQTLVTVHPNGNGAAVPYSLAQRLLKRVLMAFEPGAVAAR